MTTLPAAPALGFSFTGFSTSNPSAQQPGASLDAEFNRTNTAVGGIIAFLAASLNADGSLKSSAVQAAYTAAAGGTTGGANLADAPSAASALLAQAWAEYMPGTLPAATLAGTSVTGDHWSSRWWANFAAAEASQAANQIILNNLQIAQQIALLNATVNGQIASGAVTIKVAAAVVQIASFDLAPVTQAPGYIDGTHTVFNLIRSDTGVAVVPNSAQELIVVCDGVLQRPGTDYTVATNQITFTTAPVPDGTCWAVWISPDTGTGISGAAAIPDIIDGGTF